MSKLFIPTLKENPAEAEIISHNYMLRAGLIRQLSSGIYTFLPVGLRTLNKIADIVREEMNRAGGQELLMPAMQPGELWKETGRWEIYGPELIRLRDRRDRDFCLGPTHEEVITDLARKAIRSYRDLPLLLYQIQVKFRDEIRPRFGMMRAREFIMKDLYSFDASLDDLEKSYALMYDAYCRIFQRCGLKYQAVRADSGVIGGDVSHEFLIIAESGEERITLCENCRNDSGKEKNTCSLCGSELVEKRGIEVGHIFQLGTKYTAPMKAVFVDQSGEEKPLFMGCYGIGIGRTMAAAIEAYHDERGICWPWNLAPYQLVVIPVRMKNPALGQLAEKIYHEAAKYGYEVVLDDREVRAGHKFNDADLIGFPLQAILGDKTVEVNRIEIKVRKTGERIETSWEDLFETLGRIGRTVL
ncbi:MAG TPA: proline--tRNA ligase [Atribacteraceae bacterium]|nr:proline--tRNA ligase [Atribacteraceae bacterium]